MKKEIIDACYYDKNGTENFRFMCKIGIHDYEWQKRGKLTDTFFDRHIGYIIEGTCRKCGIVKYKQKKF